MLLTRPLAAVYLWMAFVPLAGAHHSTAPYDLVHGTIITGNVTSYLWQNPHGQISLDVAGEERTTEHWTIEIESPSVLRRVGWSKDTLKPGDTICVTGARAKNGSFNLKALTVQVPDGRKLSAIAPAAN